MFELPALLNSVVSPPICASRVPDDGFERVVVRDVDLVGVTVRRRRATVSAASPSRSITATAAPSAAMRRRWPRRSPIRRP